MALTKGLYDSLVVHSDVLDAKQECNPGQAHAQLWPLQLVHALCQVVQHFVKLGGTRDIKAKQVLHLQHKLIVHDMVSESALVSVVLEA